MKYKLTELAQKTHRKADSDAETLYHRGRLFRFNLSKLNLRETLSPVILKSTP